MGPDTPALWNKLIDISHRCFHPVASKDGPQQMLFALIFFFLCVCVVPESSSYMCSLQQKRLKEFHLYFKGQMCGFIAP